MRLPNRDIGAFARELISRCSASKIKRIDQGSRFRNLFLTGDPDGNPQTYNKTYISIDKLAAWLYSPADLRLYMETNGPAGHNERAIGERAVEELRRLMRDGGVDSVAEDAVLWSLIKWQPNFAAATNSAWFSGPAI